MPTACLCCGYYTLTQPANYEVCEICFWEDIPAADVAMRMTSNQIPLRKAQLTYLALRVCDAEYADLIRPPTSDDVRIPDWQPSEVHLRQQQHALLDRFVHHRYGMLEQVARYVDDGMLRSIAEADYKMDVEEHLAALRQIHAGKIPVPIHWEPREVLELVRWSQPDGLYRRWDGKDAGLAGHWQRAFACTALLHIAGEPENRGRLLGGEKDSLIQLIGSIIALEAKLQLPARRLLSERVLALDLGDAELPFFALGILLLAAMRPAVEPAHLGKLGTWVLTEEARIRSELLISWEQPTDHWLLGLGTYNSYAAVWQSTTVQVLRAVIPTMPPSVSSVLQTIISKIDDQS